MKKIAILISVIMACIATSCNKVRTFDPSIVLSLDNAEVNLPKSVSDTAEPVHYIHITSNGKWEATLETQDGNSWCWIQEYYLDSKGNKVFVAEPLEAFDGMEEMGRWNKVKGNGSVYLPLYYVTANANRYGILKVRRTDTNKAEVVTMRITQK